jgi:hypothetical protein
MYGLTRGTMTLIGAAAAGLLIWLASQFDIDSTNGDYWAWVGFLAGAGLVMALSQLLGGWTKWGWPRISASVFLLGFVPALVAGGLVLLHAQPDGGFGQGWAADIGVDGLADELIAVLPAIAFALGLVFGFTFDTTGPRIPDVDEEDRRVPRRYDERVAEEPMTAERSRARDRDVVTTSPSERDVVTTGPRGRTETGVAGAAAMPDRDVATSDSRDRVPANVAGAGAVPDHDGDSSATRSTEPTATRETEEPSRFRRFFSRR